MSNNEHIRPSGRRLFVLGGVAMLGAIAGELTELLIHQEVQGHLDAKLAFGAAYIVGACVSYKGFRMVSHDYRNAPYKELQSPPLRENDESQSE